MNKKDRHIISLIRNRIYRKDPEADVILFGSHARGETHKDSDWDVLILLNRSEVDKNIEKEYREELFDIELEIMEPISTFVFSKNEWETKYRVTPLYQNIKQEGVVLT